MTAPMMKLELICLSRHALFVAVWMEGVLMLVTGRRNGRGGGTVRDPLELGGDRQSDGQVGEDGNVCSNEDGAVVEVRRVYLSVDPFNTECYGVRHGVLAICEELSCS